MLTIFSIPKTFEGHIGVIQRNAIRSWTLLRPKCEIILLGNDEGASDVAEEFGLLHIPEVACTEYGTPRADSIFHQGTNAAANDLVCQISADIILMSDFIKAVEQVSANRENFVLAGQRWNVDLDQELDFQSDWEDRLRSDVLSNGVLGARTGLDYLVYPKAILPDFPPFAIGRAAFDQWFLYRTRLEGAALIDATPVVMGVHQNHHYSHQPQSTNRGVAEQEREHNIELAGGRACLFMIKDRTEVLTATGLKKPLDGWRLWRLLRTAMVLYPSMPQPVKWLVKATNSSIDTAYRVFLGLTQIRRREAPWDG